MNIYPINIKNEENLRNVCKKIGTDPRALTYLMPKSRMLYVFADDVDYRAAGFMKQEMLSRGGDVIVNKHVIDGKTEKSGILIMGTMTQIHNLQEKLKSMDIWGIKEIRERLSEVMKNISLKEWTMTSPAGHGIVGKDDVKIAGGTVTVDAARHGVQANDSVRLAEAVINITAGTDGIHVSDNKDAEEGTESDSYFYIADATVTISAGDDGIHADAQAIVEGGSITVTESYEALEALVIEISGGDLDLTASDDGINAAGGSTSSSSSGGGFDDGGSDGVISISGGNIHVQAGGDGLDANGSIEISGGTTIVEGPTQGDTSVIDFNTTGTITGGTFIGTGGAGMAESLTSAENQGVISVTTGNQSAGTTVRLTDSDGNVIAEQTPELDYAVVYISTPDLQTGKTYTLEAGTYSETIELTDSIYSNLTGMGGGFGGGRGMQGDMQGQEGFGGRDMNGEFDGQNRPDGGKGMRGQDGMGRGGSDMNGGFGSDDDSNGSNGDNMPGNGA